MYQATGDVRFKERLTYLVDELRACQEANGNGYLAAIPRGKEIFAEVARGDIRSQGFDLNGGWVPWYTEHKVFAGLRDAYVLAGIPKALTSIRAWATGSSTSPATSTKSSGNACSPASTAG